jgi:hypothetical protein
MGYNYNQGGVGMPRTAPQTSTNATISLVAGIVGLFILPMIGGIVAILTGNAAKKEIANSGGTIGGEGLAKAGVVIGWVSLALWGLGICVGVAIWVILTFLIVGATETYYFIPLLQVII